MPIQDLRLPITNRAFQYNDGFFETILVVENRLRFWEEHKARMREGAAALKLAIPDHFWSEELEDHLLQLAKQRGALKFGRMKLKVWRAGAGLYTPQSNEIEWLATADPAQPIPDTGIAIGICESVKTVFSSLSHFKGPHAPLYVLAGIEKQAKGLDDMLLLDARGFLAETISSTIFWFKGDTLYTPALETGCVNGIMRRSIFKWCQKQGILVQEVLSKPDELLAADAIFAANVTGIRVIKTLEKHQFNSNNTKLQILKAELKV